MIYPRGYFKDDDNIKAELLKIYNSVGKDTFTMKYLRKHHRRILTGIERYSCKNLKDLCDELNLDHNIIGNKYKRGYWKQDSNIKQELITWHKKVGVNNFTSEHLKEDHCMLYNAINRSDKTLLEWASLCNLKFLGTPKDYYKDINNIYKEVMSLINKYGFFPNRELLTLEGKNQIPIALAKYHNITSSEYVQSLGYNIKGQSKLEKYVKNLLDIYIEDNCYVDNRFKSLEKYGVSLYNQDTQTYLELDRYYYKQRIAIEIQGQQHYIDKAWGKSTARLHRNDQIKRRLLKEQGIKLIEIKYDEIHPKQIYRKLQHAAINKLRENWELSSTETINCEA